MLSLLVALLAVPGPDSVVVVAASADAESVALAERYARARQLPDAHLCAIDAPLAEDVGLDVFRSDIVGGIARCLERGGIATHVEALVLARGLPLRVVMPGGARASMAAALALGDTTTSTGAPILGRPPGDRIRCGGTPCDAARWNNPFRRGVFGPGWTATNAQAIWRPRIVTMLHGRTAADAARLVASATTAEALGGARGTFTFMRGADRARGVLDIQYGTAMSGLRSLGFDDVEQVGFDADRTGQRYAAFFTGTAALGRTIEGSAFAPGALVDNLTSFGALPENFRPSGEVQVSIARWVAMGVAGVHGTTDEPLNNCFPSRELIVDYAEGGTLGEAYFRALPFAYWHNLVLGDPMAAPYASRPIVRIDGLTDGDRVQGSRAITVSATASEPIDRLVVRVDGVEVASSDGSPIALCAVIPPGPRRQILAVAQVADRGTRTSKHRPKGWTALRVEGLPGPSDCAPVPVIDAGMADARVEADAGSAIGADAGSAIGADAAVAPEPPPSEGCSTTGATPALGMLVLLLAAARRKR